LSHERVKQELDKTMEQVRCPSGALETWQATGAFRSLIPALDTADASSFQIPNFLAMPGLAKRPPRRGIRFAGLSLSLSTEQASRVLIDLKASRVETNLVTSLIAQWRRHGDAIGAVLLDAQPPTDAQVRRWVAGIGRLSISAFMRLASGVWAAA